MKTDASQFRSRILTLSSRVFVFLLVTPLVMGGVIPVLEFTDGKFSFNTGIEVAHAATETFTADDTWTAPADVCEVTVHAWGAGGGGGADSSSGGGGGGGGAFASSTLSVIPGTGYTITVGVGDLSDSNNDTWFDTVSTVFADGGNSGSQTNAGTGGAAGSSIGTVTYSGGNGGAGQTSGSPDSRTGGGGGSAATTSGNGTAGQDGSAGGGGGGSGSGAGGNGSAGQFAFGANGTAAGGAGGGAGRSGTGGNGADGRIVLYYTTDPGCNDTPLSISGTLYSDEGSTQITAGRTIKAAIGTSSVSVHSTTTDSGAGTWTISLNDGGNIDAATPIVVWVDGATEKAVTVTKATGTNSISGLDLYQDYVISKHEAANGTSTTVDDFDIYDNSNDSDIVYSAATSSDTLNLLSGAGLYVWSGKHLEVPASTTVAGNYRNHGDATFDPNGTTTFSGTNVTLSGTTTGSSTLNNVIINGTVNSSSTLSVADLEILSGATFTNSSSTLSINGDFTKTGTFRNLTGQVNIYGKRASTWTKIGGDSVSSSWSTEEEVRTMTSLNGNLYAGIGSLSGSDGEVWEYSGGTWSKIGGDGVNSSWAASTYQYAYALTAANEKIYAGLGLDAGEAEVWEYDLGATSWTKVGGDDVNSSWNSTDYERVYKLIEYNDQVYAALGVSLGDAEVWTYDGSTWSKIGGDGVNSSWADSNYDIVSDLTVWNGKLYAGLGNGAADGEVWEYNGNTWTKIGGDSVNSSWGASIERVYSLAGSGDSLYAGLGLGVGESEVWQYTGGSWTQIGGDFLNGSWEGDPQQNVFSMAASGEKVFASIGSGTGGDGEVWEYDGTFWTKIGGDSVNSSWGTAIEDVSSLIVANGSLYAGLGYGSGDSEIWEITYDSTVAGSLTGTDALGNVGFGIASTTLPGAASSTDFSVYAGTHLTAPNSVTVAGDYLNEGWTEYVAATYLDSANAQTLTGVLTDTGAFTDLIMVGAGAKSATQNIEVAGDYVGGIDFGPLSDIEFSGGTTQNFSGSMVGADAFNTVTFTGAGTKVFAANASTSDFTIASTSGTVTFPSGQLTASGTLSNNATIDANGGTVYFQGDSSATGTLTGTNALANVFVGNENNLTFGAPASTTGTFTIAGTSTIDFQATSTYTFQNINWVGNSSSTDVTIQSSVPGTVWYLDVPGTKTVQYINVSDSDATLTSGGITATDSRDDGNNTNWSFTAGGSTVTWDGGGDGSDWYDPLNWSGDTVPTSTDDVVIDTNVTVNIGTSTTILSLTVGSSTVLATSTLNFAYQATNDPLIVAGDVVMHASSSLTHSANPGADTLNPDYSANLYVQGNFTVSASSTINLHGKGRTTTGGTGYSGNADDGSGHGGFGGDDGGDANGGGAAYGSTTAPTSIGAAGNLNNAYGTGGAVVSQGGGALKLTVLGTTTIDGTIIVDGLDGNKYSGASAGSVYITANHVTGSGSITANGDDGYGSDSFPSGGGAGGRIAIIASTTDIGSTTITAYGGTGGLNYHGAAGTIYIKTDASTYGQLIIDNNSKTLPQLNQAAGTPVWLANLDSLTLDNSGVLLSTSTFSVVDEVVVDNYAVLNIESGTTTIATTTIEDGATLYVETNGEFLFDKFTFGTSSTLIEQGLIPNRAADFVVPTTTTYLPMRDGITFDSLTINGTTTHFTNPGADTLNPDYYLNIIVNGDFTLGSSGSINLQGKGRTTTGGTGYPTSGDDGAGHGGYGGESSGTPNEGGAAYGSTTAPTSIGATGAFNGAYGTAEAFPGQGGGAVQLTVYGTSTIDGTINVNAGDGNKYGGASGGSVYIISDHIEGTGSITANGEDGHGNDSFPDGGGAGGRIALIATTSNIGSLTMQAIGGTAALTYEGAAGTIYTKIGSEQYGSLLIDNGGRTSDTAATPVAVGYNSFSLDDLTIQNAAELIAPTSTLTIYGDYTNNATFDASAATTTFAGTSLQTATGTMTGASAFNNVEVTNTSGTDAQSAPGVIFGAATEFANFTASTSGVMVQFESGATTTMANLYITGTASDYVYLYSTDAGTQWNIDVTGTESVDYVFVKDSNACSSTGGNIPTTNSGDSNGNNSCWDGLAALTSSGNGPGVVITGTLYENDGVTPIGAGKLIFAAVGTSTVSLHSTTTDVSSNYSIESIATSTIGAWATTSFAANSINTSGVVYGNGIFVAVGSGVNEGAMTSPDGLNWTNRSAAGDNDTWGHVTYGKGLFVAVGDASGSGDAVMTSPDGINWTARSAAGDNDYWRTVTYGEGLFVAAASCSQGGDDCLMYSEDGINWTVANEPANIDEWWKSSAYGNGTFVVTGLPSNMALYSNDGINWATTSAASNEEWSSVAYGNGQFLAIGKGADVVMTSPDGVTWTANPGVNPSGSYYWGNLVYANGLYVANQWCNDVGGPCVTYSNDGVNWSTSTNATSTMMNAGITAYGNGRFINVSSNKIAYTDAGFGEDTPITIFVDENATTSSSTATTLTYGLNHDAGTTTITADLRADTLWLHKPTVGSSSNKIYLSDADFYNQYDAQLADADDWDILFTATTSTTTINADLYIDASTTVFAPQHLVIDGDFANQGTFYAERGEVVADSTTFDMSSARYIHSTTSLDADTSGLHFSPDGTKFFYIGWQDDDAVRYDLSVPWDIRTMTYTHATSLNAFDSSPEDLHLSDDGTKLFMLSWDTDEVEAFTLATPWDLTTASYLTATSVTAQSGSPYGLSFSESGDKMFMLGGGINVYEYALSTEWDISTAAYTQSYSLGSTPGIEDGIAFSPDGLSLFTSSRSSAPQNNIYKHNLTTAWDVSSASYQGEHFRQHTDYSIGLTVDSAGRYVYNSGQVIGSGQGDTIAMYELDTEQYFTGNFSATSSLWDLTVGDTATVSPAATTEVDNDYHVGGSAAGPYAGLVELTGTSTLSGTGNFGFVEVQGSASSTGSAATFADLTIASGGDFTAPTYGTLTITGDLDSSAGSFDVNGATTYFGGQGTYNLNLTYRASTSLSAQDTSPSGVTFSTDGKKMYATGDTGNDINEYTLSTPWDITSASFVVATSTATHETVPRGVFIHPEGLYIYFIGTNSDAITSYRLVTPYDLSTATFAASSSVATGGAPRGLHFKQDGSMLFVTDQNNDRLYSYTLTTPWDITTLTNLQQSSSIASQNTLPSGVTLNAEGTKAWINGRNTADEEINEYTLTTAWDVTTLSFNSRYDLTSYEETSNIQGLAVSSDGTNLYVVIDTNSDIVVQFDVSALISTSTAGNALSDVIFSASGASAFDGNASTSDFTIQSNATVTAPTSLTIDGIYDNNGVFAANSGTVYLTGIPTFDNDVKYVQNFSVSSHDNAPNTVEFKPDGTKMYVSGTQNDRIHEYNLSTAWDVTTAALVASTSVLANTGTTPRHVHFKPDGTKLFISDETADEIDAYTLTTPWDITTLTYADTTTVVNTNQVNVGGLFFKTDGTTMYVVDTNITVNDINEYSLSTPWDITTASYVDNILVEPRGNTSPSGFTFTPDGTKFFITGYINNDDPVFEYHLSTPWDISTATYYDYGYKFDPTDNSPQDITFSSNGEYLYLVGTESDSVNQFRVIGGNGYEITDDFNHLVVASGTLNIIGAATTTGNFTVAATATATSPTTTFAVAGSFANNGVWQDNGGTVRFTGTSQTLSGTLTGTSDLGDISVSGSYTLSNNASTTDLTIESGGSLTAPSQLTVDGDFTNNGTFTANSGEVTLEAKAANMGDPIFNDWFDTYDVATAYDLTFSATGTYMYTLSAAEVINQYILSTPWDITTASNTPQSLSVASLDSSGGGIFIDPTGTLMFYVGAANDEVHEITLGTPWDISSGSQTATSSAYNDGTDTPNDVWFSPDGTRMFISHYDSIAADNIVQHYSLSTAWDITTASLVENTGGLWSDIGYVYNVALSPDGYEMFVLGGTSAFDINRFTLAAPWDISAWTFEDDFDAGHREDSEDAFTFGDNFSKLYITGDQNDYVLEYDLDPNSQTASGTLTGSSAFYDLTQDTDFEFTFGASASTTNTFAIEPSALASTSATTTIFQAGATYTFQNIDWQGASSTNELVLRSSASGTQWYLDVPGSQLNVEYVNVQDSDATPTSGGINATNNNTDSGNNTNWQFTATAAPPEEWNNTDWTLYDTITIKAENIDEDLYDFPVYVNLADLSPSFWATTPSAANLVGTDIRVTTDTPHQELPRELVSASSTAETGELHFKADYINANNDTTFYLWYNGTTTGDYSVTATSGAQNVWTNNFISVYHLEESGNDDPGGYLDSTANQAHATGSGMSDGTTDVGQLGNTQTDFNGTDEYIETSGNGVENVDDVTVSLWANTDDIGGGGRRNMLWQGDSAGNCGGEEAEFHFNFGNCIGTNADRIQLFVEDSSGGDLLVNYTTVDAGVQGSWHHLVGTMSNLTTSMAGSIYLDSIEVASSTGGVADFSTWDTPLRIGADGLVSRAYDGHLDEVRISSTTRSDAWIRAEYKNQSTTTDFYFLSSGTGSSTLSDHDAGQVDSQFTFQNVTNGELFAFKLTPESGTATITEVTLDLGGAKRINTSDFSNIRLLQDNDADAAYDATDVVLDSNGVITLGNVGYSSNSNQRGTIVFSTDFLSTTTMNYLVVADWNAPNNGAHLTFDLEADGIIASDSNGGHLITGTVDHIQHNRNQSYGGGGGTTAQVGGPPPEGDGDVSGGTNEGGELIGDNPDFYWPSADSGAFSNGANAYDNTDGTYATNAASTDHTFQDYAHGVPGTDTIAGIEVKLEVSYTSGSGVFDVELSWDGGTSWTSTKSTGSISNTDTVVSLGGPSDTWGRSWTPAQFSDANFRVRISGNPSANTAQIDEIQVKVYHQATGGGGGGGGGAI